MARLLIHMSRPSEISGLWYLVSVLTYQATGPWNEMQSVFLKKIPLICLVQIHCSCGYFWPGQFFPAEKNKISKNEFAVVSIFSRLLIREGKINPCNHLSPSLPLLCVLTPSLGGVAPPSPHMRVCVHFLALTDTNTHIKNHLYTCSHIYVHFVLLDFVWNFWSKSSEHCV